MNFEKPSTETSAVRKETPVANERSSEMVKQEMTRWMDARSRKLDEQTLSRTKPEERQFYKEQGLEMHMFAHGSLDIQFVGVAHDPKNLALHRQELEKAISEADLVVYEGGIAGDVAIEEEVTLSEETTEVESDSQVVKMRLPDGLMKPYQTFFSETVNMAKKHGKQAVTLDPLSDHRLMKSLVRDGGAYEKPAKVLERKVEHASYDAVASGKVAVLGGAVGVIASLALLAKKIEEDSAKKSGLAKEQFPVSRRRFVGMGAAVATMAAGGVLTRQAEQNIKAIHKEGDTDSYDKWSQFNLVDYRDVAIAEGIDALSKKVSPNRRLKVAMIYGKGHRSGVQSYLENPTVRSVKKQAYGAFVRVAPPEINAYRFDVRADAPPVKNGESMRDDRWGEWARTLHMTQPW